MPGFPIKGDLELSADGRELVIISGPERVAQALTVAAQVFKGSWRYDLNLGVPYFQEILVAGPELELVKQRFREMALRVAGVAAVSYVTLEQQGAIISVDIVVRTDDDRTAVASLEFQAT